MEKSTKVKLIFCALLSVLSLWLLAPTLWSLSHPDKADKLPSWMPKTAMRLGLDLQGGIHMVLGVDLDKVVNDQLATYGRSLEKNLTKAGVQGAKFTVNPQKFELELTVASAADKDKVAAEIAKDFPQALDFVGDTGNLLVLRLSRMQEDYVRTHAIDQSIETLRNRIDEFGVAEPVLARKGDNQILVQFPGAKDSEHLKGLIGQTAQLSFQIVPDCQDPACLAKQRADLETKIQQAEQKGGYNREKITRLSDYAKRINQDLKPQLPPDTVVAFQKEQDVNQPSVTHLIPYLLSTKHVVSGEYIENAFVQMQRQERRGGIERPVVAFQLNAAGTPLFGQMTSEFEHHYMAIVLDGIVRSAPIINTAITGGQGVIEMGAGSLDELNRESADLSIVLRAGALPATIEVQEERVIGPSIGRDAIEAGRKALTVTSVLIFVFMLAYYGLSGLIGNFVTAINIALIFAILGMVGATLTLPGIAGIVLTIGMAVDALIIIFERMREEMRAGRPTRQVVSLGFDHAFATILDSNVTTAIGAFVLLEYGTGTVRGFALTLLVGIVVNVFMATFFAKVLFEAFMTHKKELSIGLSQHEVQSIRAQA